MDSFPGSKQQCNLFTKTEIFCLSPKPFLVHSSNFLAVCANRSSTRSPACHPIPNPLIPVVSLLTCVPVFLTLHSFISYDRSFLIQPFSNSSLFHSPFMTCLPLPGYWCPCPTSPRPLTQASSILSLPSSVFSWRFSRFLNYFINEP